MKFWRRPPVGRSQTFRYGKARSSTVAVFADAEVLHELRHRPLGGRLVSRLLLAVYQQRSSPRPSGSPAPWMSALFSKESLPVQGFTAQAVEEGKVDIDD